MLRIIPHIEYLSRRNDCVVLPGFGAFIAHCEPATIAADGRLIPPLRSISFNSAVCHNDGLLATSIMRREGISYDAALKLIQEEVSALKVQLSENGEVELGNLGKFVDYGSISFEPKAIANIMPSSFFGFSALAIEPIVKEEECFELSDFNEDEKPTIIRMPVWKNIARIAASIVILVVLAFVLSTPMPMQKPDYASVVPAINVAKQAKKCESQIVEEPQISQPQEEPQQIEESIQTKDKYYLIVGAFKSKERAEVFIKESKLSGLKIMEKEGGSFYKIYSASSSDIEEIQLARTEIATTNPNAWIYTEK